MPNCWLAFLPALPDTEFRSRAIHTEEQYRGVVKRMDFGIRLEMLALPFIGCMTFGKLCTLYLSFHTCKMGITIVLISSCHCEK